MTAKSKGATHNFEGKASINGSTMLFTQFGIDSHPKFHEPSEDGLTGTRQPTKGGRILLQNDVNGSVSIRPSYAQASALLALFFDGTTTFTPKDDPSAMSVPFVCDYKDVVRTYAACWLNKLKISARENEPVKWDLEVLGTTDAAAGSVAFAAAPDPMIFSDISIAIGSNTYYVVGFEWEFAYNLVSRFHNSVTRSAATPDVYTSTLKLMFDQNSDHYADLMALAATNTTIASIVLTATNAVNTMAVTHGIMTNISDALMGELSGGQGNLERSIDLKGWSADGSADMVSITYA